MKGRLLTREKAFSCQSDSSALSPTSLKFSGGEKSAFWKPSFFGNPIRSRRGENAGVLNFVPASNKERKNENYKDLHPAFRRLSALCLGLRRRRRFAFVGQLSFAWRAKSQLRGDGRGVRRFGNLRRRRICGGSHGRRGQSRRSLAKRNDRKSVLYVDGGRQRGARVCDEMRQERPFLCLCGHFQNG